MPELDLQTRKLGRTELEITTVGLGAWAMGGRWRYGWGHQDDERSIEAIKRAVDLGINWIDTAATYGVGHSEEVVGRALHEIAAADRPFVFTKLGEVGDPEHPFAEPVKTLHPKSMRRELEASLRRLRVDAIDLYQFHWPDEQGVPVEESWGEMGRFIEEGKVRHAGVSNFDVPLLERCEAIRHVESLQPPFSLVRRESADALIPWALAHETGVIVYGPLSHGVLTDSFSLEAWEALPEDDWRRSRWERADVARNLEVRDALRPIAERHRVSVAAVAAAWVAAWPGVTAAICGARGPEQLDGWVRAATFTLTAADLEEIAEALERIGIGSGPVRPGPAT